MTKAFGDRHEAGTTRVNLLQRTTHVFFLLALLVRIFGLHAQLPHTVSSYIDPPFVSYFLRSGAAAEYWSPVLGG